MAEIQDLTATAGSHARFPEGQAPSTLNDGARVVEGILSRWFFDTNYSVVATVSGTVIQMTANRASITLTSTTSNYVADLLMGFTVGSSALVGPLSVNINGIGAISLRDSDGTSLSGSIAPSGAKLQIVKDATNDYFRIASRQLPYAEGTFTPAIAFGGAAVGVTYAAQVGFYTKIGNRVLFNLYIELTSNGSSVGTFTITGLPFTAKNTTNAYAPFAIYGGGLSGMSGHLQGYVAPNATGITVTYLGTGSVAGLDDTKVSDTASFIIGGQYMT